MCCDVIELQEVSDGLINYSVFENINSNQYVRDTEEKGPKRERQFMFTSPEPKKVHLLNVRSFI